MNLSPKFPGLYFIPVQHSAASIFPRNRPSPPFEFVRISVTPIHQQSKQSPDPGDDRGGGRMPVISEIRRVLIYRYWARCPKGSKQICVDFAGSASSPPPLLAATSANYRIDNPANAEGIIERRRSARSLFHSSILSGRALSGLVLIWLGRNRR